MNNIRFSSRISGFFALASLLVVTAAGCSSDDKGASCGTGTVLDKKLNRCVLDGTVVCSGNTRFDTETGTCVADAGLCAEGTVLLEGKCVPEDEALTGSVSEASEPNDLQVEGATAATLTLPAEGQTTTFKGCVVPADFNSDGALDSDYDDFVVTTTGPTLVEVTVDGVRGLAGAFMVTSKDEHLTSDGWSRLGLDPTSDTSSRQLFLPTAGEFVISVSDTRSFAGLVAGNEKACYFGQLKTITTPAASSVAVGDQKNGVFKDPGFFATTATAGQVLVPVLAPTEARNVIGAVTVLKNGAYLTSFAASDAGGQAGQLLFGFDAGDAVTFVAEYVQNVDPDEAPYAFVLDDADSHEFTASGTVNLTDGDDLFPSHTLYFDGTAGDVVHAAFTSTTGISAQVVDATGTPVATVCDGGCEEADAWFPIPTSGHYYMLVTADEGGTPYTVTFTRASVTPAALTVGTGVTASLATNDRAFYTLDFTGTTWLEFVASALTGLSSADVRLYPIAGVGALDSEVMPSVQYTLDGIASHGYVSKGDTRRFLVSISNHAAHTGNETLTFTARERTITNFGDRSEANPVASTAATLAANETKYFLISASPGSKLHITADPDGSEDVFIKSYNPDESQQDAAGDIGAGGIETLDVALTSQSFVAFSVATLGGAAGGFHIAVTLEDPPYTQTTGTLPYNDACSGGTVVLDANGGYISAPVNLDTFTFTYFGQTVPTILVGADGWLTTDGTYDGDGDVSPADTFPTEEDFHGVIAPFWDYLSNPTVCVKKTATEVTVQWEGSDLFGAFFGQDIPLKHQAVLHSDGTVDFIYATDPTGASSTTIGMEDLDGTLGVNHAGLPGAGTSITWTPTN